MKAPDRAIRLPLAGVSIALLLALLLTPLRPAGPLAPAARAQPVQVGLVPDGPLDDQSFNRNSYQGLRRAEEELGVAGTVYTPTSALDYEPKLQQCAADGNDLCIAVGFAMGDAIWNVAQANPGTDFAIVDFTWGGYPANLRGITFASVEGAYLAGTLAGLMTESDVLGVIGGMPIPPVDDFVYGFRNGARCANISATVLISYTHDFMNPNLGAQYARAMLDAGADTVFAPAGGTAGGALLTTTQSGAWGIGVDVDMYYTVFAGGTVPGADRLLTSALKRMDNAVFDTIADVVSGAFTPGTRLYNLAEEGVGIAPFHDAEPFVPQAVRDQLELVRRGIVSGTIDPRAPCWAYGRYVDASGGSDAGDCADPQAPCASIGYVLGQAQPDDRILVAGGTYTENLTVDRRVSLLGGYSGPPDWERDLALYPTTIRSGSATVPGDWDGSGVGAPVVVSLPGELALWYGGRDLYGRERVGQATSLDGISWDKSPANPLLDGSEFFVLENGPADYTMWYSRDQAIYRAISGDGLSWTTAPTLPVFTPTHQEGSWERDGVWDPSVVQDGGGTYWMFYEALNGDWNLVQIGAATSSDGIAWTRVQADPVLSPGAPGAWDELWALDPMVLYEGGAFRMWYGGINAGGARRIGYAASPDGIHWIKDEAHNPVFAGDPGQWDDGSVIAPFVLHDGGYGMWYQSNGAIGYVTSTEGLTWTRFLVGPVLVGGEFGQWGASVVGFYQGSAGAVLDGFIVSGGDSDAGAGLRITGESAPGPAEPGEPGFEYWASACLTLPVALSSTEAITVYVEGGDVVMSHTGALYNCCAVMAVDFENQASLLGLIERQTYPGGGPCYCLCPHNLGARISGLVPGEYQVEVWDEPNNRLILAVPVTIPGRVAGIEAGEAPEDILVQNCVITANHAYNDGGGIRVFNGASALISATAIVNNTANWGGGVLVDLGGVATILAGEIRGNTAGSSGGGIDAWWPGSTVDISFSTIAGNLAGDGGGIHATEGAAVHLTHVTLLDNTANRAGGGLSVEQRAWAEVAKADFLGNSALWGGGLHLWNAAAVLDGCRVQGNGAGDSGGGIRLGENALLTMTNGLVVGNSCARQDSFAGIEFAWPASGGRLVNVTVADNGLDNDVGGIRHADPSWPLTIWNAIVYGNGGEQLRCEGGAGCDVTYSDVEGGWSGVGNIDAPPLFVGGGDYHLRAGSPCIDAGTAAGAPDHDIEGDRRPFGGGVDMGADEWWVRLGVNLGAAAAAGSGAPGATVVYTLALTNTGEYTDSYDLAAGGAWTPTLSLGAAGPLAPGAGLTMTLAVQVPEDAQAGAMDTAAVTATSQLERAVSADVRVTTTALPTKFYVYLPLVLRQSE